jgi:hypothetical protein
MRPEKIFRLVFLSILSLALSGVSAGKIGRREGAPAKESSATPLPSRDGQINRAYLDAAGILSEDNTCSRFFGGSKEALTVLTRLSGQLRKTSLAPTVGIRMYGAVMDVTDSAHSLRYRVFERAEVNVAGPFNARQAFPNGPHIPNVGSFQPGTREARVLMLLHEMGHLIVGPDGNWLLPNDGNDEARSEENTRLVESKCGEQIRTLRNW